MQSVLKPASLAAAIATCTLVSAIAQAQMIPIDTARITRPVIGETNNYRAANGVAALESNAALTQAAQQYAEYLARTNTTGHTADGRTVGQRIAATNAYQPCYYAENVYEYWSTPTPASPPVVATSAMTWWKNSPGHDANLRDARGRHIGVGAAAWTHGDRHYYKVVQVFASDCGTSKPTQGSAVPPTSSEVLRPGRSAGATAIRLAEATCKPGFVWRVARASDLVCVTPDSRARVADENRIAAQRVQPGGGAYGPYTCRPGYVWREAFSGDVVCVTPQVRQFVWQENALAASRRL